MKSYKFLAIAVVALGLFSGCDKHDSMDDDVIVGPKAPQVYWEVESSTVKAGTEAPFSTQYYTTAESEIDHLEVWYDINEKESQSIACPWVKSFAYNVTVSKDVQKRISQLIQTYDHSEEFWEDSCRAYTFKNTFPTSNTLASVNWVFPQQYEETKLDQYFGEQFAKNFRDSLYVKLKYQDFQDIILGIYPDTASVKQKAILACKDSTWDENSQSWKIHFKGNEVPENITKIFNEIPFDSLVFNSGKQYYDIQYTRQYYIKANLRCVDEKGVYGTAIEKNIDLN